MSSCTCFSNSISAAVRDALEGIPSRLGGAEVCADEGRLLPAAAPVPPLLELGIFTERFGRQLPTAAAAAAALLVSDDFFAFRESESFAPPAFRFRLPPLLPVASESSSSFFCSFKTSTAWRFFTALSVRPPTMRAISVHLFPCSLWPSSKI